MPQERESQYPVMDKAAWDEARAGVPRHIQAARLIVARKVTGIPFTPYLSGKSDSAPVVQGVAEFADKVYNLLDALDDGTDELTDSAIKTAIRIVTDAMEKF